MAKSKPQKIFSGDYSAQMWAQINGARTIADLRRALYTVCCRLQELEARLPGRKAATRRRGKRDAGWITQVTSGRIITSDPGRRVKG